MKTTQFQSPFNSQIGGLQLKESNFKQSRSKTNSGKMSQRPQTSQTKNQKLVQRRAQSIVAASQNSEILTTFSIQFRFHSEIERPHCFWKKILKNLSESDLSIHEIVLLPQRLIFMASFKEAPSPWLKSFKSSLGQSYTDFWITELTDSRAYSLTKKFLQSRPQALSLCDTLKDYPFGRYGVQPSRLLLKSAPARLAHYENKAFGYKDWLLTPFQKKELEVIELALRRKNPSWKIRSSRRMLTVEIQKKTKPDIIKQKTELLKDYTLLLPRGIQRLSEGESESVA